MASNKASSNIVASEKASPSIVADDKIIPKSKFEGIPAETRNRIYGYVFSGEFITCINTHICRYCEAHDFHHGSYEQHIRHSISWLVALFRTNKFLRGDVKSSFFQHVTFKLLYMHDDHRCFSISNTGYPWAKGGIPSLALFSQLSYNTPMPDFFAKNLKHVAMPWFLLDIVSELLPNMPALETVTMHDFNLTLWHSWSLKEIKKPKSEEERKAQQIVQENSPEAVLGDSDLEVKALLQEPNNNIKVFLLRTLVKCKGHGDRENANYDMVEFKNDLTYTTSSVDNTNVSHLDEYHPGAPVRIRNDYSDNIGCCADCDETDEYNSDDDSDEDSQDWTLLARGHYKRNLGEEFYDDKGFFVTERCGFGNPTEVDKSIRRQTGEGSWDTARKGHSKCARGPVQAWGLRWW